MVLFALFRYLRTKHMTDEEYFYFSENCMYEANFNHTKQYVYLHRFL